MSSSINSLQVWDNAAFDESPLGLGPGPLQPISLNLKENRQPPIKKPSVGGGGGGIDEEIAEIEGEIGRLSKKLEALKIKKAQISLAQSKTPGPTAKRGGGGGRIVPAKFLNLETPPPPPPSSAKRVQESRRRGVSLGPMEIYQNATPLRSQKPSSKKLEGIKEEKAKDSARRRGMSLGPSEILRQGNRAKEVRSTSPKPRKPMNSRVSDLRKGISTVGAKNQVKLDQGSISGIKPKTLFEEKKRPFKNAKVRIVASRYNEGGNKRRKWSLPENDEEENRAKIKMRSFSLGGLSSPPSMMKIAEGLPKIKTLRAVVESPRNSGCAKRVADLVGRKSCFAEEGSSLNFEDVEDLEN